MKTSMLAALVAVGLIGRCELSTGLKDGVVTGTWGGDNAGLIADDTSAHVHIACTYGNVHQGIEPDGQGRFDVAGEYVLRAYPVAVGPPLPAQFAGSISGRVMTLSVTVSDTTADTTAHLGPVQLYLDREAKMQMCPICRTPGERTPM
jgi:hypothetical protein